jgi:translocator protein
MVLRPALDNPHAAPKRDRRGRQAHLLNERIRMRISTLTATIGSLASRPSIQSNWYRGLRKPGYQPAQQVFPVVWPALYADIALVSASAIDGLHHSGESHKARAYLGALGLNLVLNGGWSWLFFNRHYLGASVAAAGVLAASSAELTRRAVAARGWRGAPLALYPLWCAFATALSTHIWLLNHRQS